MRKPASRELETIKEVRARARVDLLYLCRTILGYDKVCEEVHGPVVDRLQHFEEVQGKDYASEEGWFYYEPKFQDPVHLTGHRRRLFLDPRGHYKTTVISIAHTIQWILNFPDVWILLIHASLPQVLEKFGEIRDKFRYEKALRYYFPDFCPARKMDAWGTSEDFSVPNRQIVSGTPTLSAASIEKIKQGSHYHVLKFCDIVGEENSTDVLVKKTVKKFGLFRNLLVGPKYWMDVEGTRYHFEDVYGNLADQSEAVRKKGPLGPQDWRVFCRSCFLKDRKGTEPQYTPDELDAPDLFDAGGHEIPLFPAVNSWEDLDAMRHDSTYGVELFAAQMRNNPVATGEAHPFPPAMMCWMPDRTIGGIAGRHEITVDTADTSGETSNDSAITTCKVDQMQRRYVRDVRVGKFTPTEIIDHIFGAAIQYKAAFVKIEEYAFVRGLKPMIDQKSHKLGYYPNFVFIKRDTRLAKKDRILNTLQPWYKARMLRFSDGLPDWVKERIKQELGRFPKYAKDDVLDTLADQFQGIDYFGPTGDRDPDLTEAQQEEKEQREQDEWRKKAIHRWLLGEEPKGGDSYDIAGL